MKRTLVHKPADDARVSVLSLVFLLGLVPVAQAGNCFDYEESVHWVSSFHLRNVFGIAVDGAYAYATSYDARQFLGSLYVFDISNPDSLRPIATLEFTGPTQPHQLTVSSNHLYMATDFRNGSSGLIVVDVSRPEEPHVAGSIAITGPGYAWDVAVQGSLAFLADGPAGLRTIDVSDPSAPMLISTLDTAGSASGLVLLESHILIADESSVLAVDISDASRPSIIGQLPARDRALAIAIAGDHAYVADGASGLDIVDISNLGGLRMVGVDNITGSAADVCVADSHAYVASDFGGLQVYDVSEPAHPFDTGTVKAGRASCLTLAGPRLYIGGSSVEVVAVPRPIFPILHHIEAPEASRWGVAVGAGLVYFTGNGLEVVFESADNNRVVGTLPLATSLIAASPHARRAYAMNGINIWVIDADAPEAPSIAGQIELTIPGNDMTLAGDYAYVATSPGFEVVKIVPAEAPSIVTYFDTHSDSRAIALKDSCAYVLDTAGNITVMNVANPARPRRLSSIAVAGARDIAVEGQYACLVGSELHVMDVSAPEMPFIIGTTGLPSRGDRVVVKDGIAYVGMPFWDAAVYDLSLPDSPRIIGSLDLVGDLTSLAVGDEHGYCTLRIWPSIKFPLQCAPPAPPPVEPEINTLLAKPLAEGIRITWQAKPEQFTGFVILRAEGKDPDPSSYRPLNSDPEDLIPGNCPCQYIDQAVLPDATYSYMIEGFFSSGQVRFGPVIATASKAPPALAWPNPSAGNVSFGVGNTATTTAIEIFNLMGQRVRGLQVMGGRRSQAISWDGNDDAGQPVPSGTYWVRLGSDPLRVTIIR